MNENNDSVEIIPLDQRQPWYIPAVIFGGLEFCIPVLLVGGILATNFGFEAIFFILLVGLVGVQWVGNAVAGYIGAKTGLTSTGLAAISFGREQSRLFVGMVILALSLGWWAIQTTVATDALANLVGIERSGDFFLYTLATLVVGLLFAAPSILGYNSIKIVDMIAIPAGLLLIVGALYLSLKNIGWTTISNWSPKGEMSLLSGINIVIGINVVQWLLAADYTRHARPIWRDNILIPLGIIGIGFPLFLVGAVMSVGAGSADIVQVMRGLGFPAWGFVFLWIATWTSQLVNNYTGGLVLCNLFKTTSDTHRKLLTLIFALIGIGLALFGIMDQFVNFLYLTALVIPAIVGVIVAHFFYIDGNAVRATRSWNWKATIATGVGLAVGCITQYIYSFGVPAIQALGMSGVAYVLVCKFSYGK